MFCPEKIATIPSRDHLSNAQPQAAADFTCPTLPEYLSRVIINRRGEGKYSGSVSTHPKPCPVTTPPNANFVHQVRRSGILARQGGLPETLDIHNGRDCGRCGFYTARMDVWIPTTGTRTGGGDAEYGVVCCRPDIEPLRFLPFDQSQFAFDDNPIEREFCSPGAM